MNTAFLNPEAAANALERISHLTGTPLPQDLFINVASPDQALQNLETWLRATTNPGLQLQQLLDDPELGCLLVGLLGASQPIADSLIQNPELASLVFDRASLDEFPFRAVVEEQG